MLQISGNLLSLLCSFFTVHGSADETIPVEDAYEFAKHIPTHKLCVIEGADHCYTKHRKELSDAVVGFITSNKVLKNVTLYFVLCSIASGLTVPLISLDDCFGRPGMPR